jgi:hypothetical protein
MQQILIRVRMAEASRLRVERAGIALAHTLPGLMP